MSNPTGRALHAAGFCEIKGHVVPDKVDFKYLREVLMRMHSYAPVASRVAIAWDGSQLSVVFANPDIRTRPMQMRFDQESDYHQDPEVLLNQFREQTKEWFSNNDKFS